MRKSADAFRTISEVSAWLDAPTHVLRFWESKFPQVKPVKRAGGRRYYRPEDMLLLGGIKQLLHNDGITIKGVQKILKEQGVKHVSSLSHDIGDGGKAPKATKAQKSDTAVEQPVADPSPKVEPEIETPSADTPLEPLQLTPSDAHSAPMAPPVDTRVNDGTYAAEDTPWAKPAAVETPIEAPVSAAPTAPAAPTGEYVRRFGFVADDANSASDQDGTPDTPPSAEELGHLRPGPVTNLRYRDRDGAPIYPHRSYAPTTLAAIQTLADKLREMGQAN